MNTLPRLSIVFMVLLAGCGSRTDSQGQTSNTLNHPTASQSNRSKEGINTTVSPNGSAATSGPEGNASQPTEIGNLRSLATITGTAAEAGVAAPKEKHSSSSRPTYQSAPADGRTETIQ